MNEAFNLYLVVCGLLVNMYAAWLLYSIACGLADEFLSRCCRDEHEDVEQARG